MAFEPYNWTCPFCHRAQTVTEAQHDSHTHVLHIGKTKYGRVGYIITAKRCANGECGEVELHLYFASGEVIARPSSPAFFKPNPGAYEFYRVRPSSTAKPQPGYIPKALVDDYYEACKIRELSPKASATLARRILQGAIRDFCKITRKRLVDEIDALKALADEGKAPAGVDPMTIDAMHDIRSIGNIGAHMEADINVIVDVDPGEAVLLIELVEMLFKDWYVARDERHKRIANVKAVAHKKAEDRKALPKTAT